MDEATYYEITEIRYSPTRTRAKLDFQGTMEEAKKKAWELAKENIGVRYVVFRHDAVVAEHQAYYRTTVTCPKCGEVIPLE